jgi:hypothetical protein
LKNASGSNAHVPKCSRHDFVFVKVPQLRVRPSDWRVCPSAACRRLVVFALHIVVDEDFELSHIDLVWTSSFKTASRNLLHPVRGAARALLRSLQVSRERAARKIIQDYRHLLHE